MLKTKEKYRRKVDNLEGAEAFAEGIRDIVHELNMHDVRSFSTGEMRLLLTDEDYKFTANTEGKNVYYITIERNGSIMMELYFYPDRGHKMDMTFTDKSIMITQWGVNSCSTTFFHYKK